ncbi:MAG: hypothetical protein M0R46_06480 [Candidatus Muirbacterium halophilum]|nr:hypothetical protein [Candidatus Muirbacterium halophilum]
MNIKSLETLKYDSNTDLFDMFIPQFLNTGAELNTYVVQIYEEMRIDSVMMSMYNNDVNVLSDIDVILFINGIDNPLNIQVGDILYYPPIENLSSYRNVYDSKQSTDIKKILATPNKTTKTDNNRTSYVENGYTLPPVVMEQPKEPVRVEDNKIVIGGLN